MADEWKYGQQPLDRPEGSPTYLENTPLMRPMGGDMLLRWEQREPPVSARLELQDAAPFGAVAPPEGAVPFQAVAPPQEAPPSQEAAHAQEAYPSWNPPGGVPAPAPPPQNPYEQPPAAPPWAGYYPPYGMPQGYQLPMPYGFYPYGMPLPYGAVPYGPGHPGSFPPTEAAPGQAAPPPFYWIPQAPGVFGPAAPHADAQPSQPAQPTQPAWGQPQPPQPSFSPPGARPPSPEPQSSLAPQPPPAFAWDEEEDWDDGGEPALKAPSQEPLPTPATVPVTAPVMPIRKKRRRGLAPLILSVLLLGAAFALYFTGVVDSHLQAVSIPTWSETMARLRAPETAPTALPQETPAAQETPVQEEAMTLEEALEEPQADGQSPSARLAQLKSFGVSLREAQAPATLVFTLRTNAAVSDIRLLLPDNQPLPVSNINKTPTVDGIIWQLAVDFKEPFEGDVSAFLRYDASIWADGGLNCTVAVKSPEETPAAPAN